MFSILVDQREPDHIKNLKILNILPTPTLLDAGDYWVATEDNQLLIIERKTPEDLLGSIKDGRLFEQCHRMKTQSKWCYVVITNVIYSGSDGKAWANGKRLGGPKPNDGWNYNSVDGTLLTIQELGVFVVHCKNEMDFGPTVERLIKRERGLLSIGCVRSSNILSAGEQVLTSLPGIGLTRMQKLLERHYTPARVFEHLSQTHLPTKKALGLQDDESYVIVNSNDREFLDLPFLGLSKEKTNDSQD